MLTKAPRGSKDIYGEDSSIWVEIENLMRFVCEDFGFEEIRTPMFEHTELFARGVGETTDIVQKEMYTFSDKKGRSLTLKPEGTAGVVRAYLENKIYANNNPTKLFYITPCFRYEKPQAGRYRQFHQFGVELFGSDHPLSDVEVITLAYLMLESLGIEDIKIKLNNLGNEKSRDIYNKELMKYLLKHEEGLCGSCKERMTKNPLRVLDCKSKTCRPIIESAPIMLDYIDNQDREKFNTILSLLDEIEINYTIDTRLVRGLDYYTGTVFEFISDNLGAQATVCGGGRYNKLIEEFGGQATPAIGFAVGIERLIMILEAQEKLPKMETSPYLFIGYMGEKAMRLANKITYRLREEGIMTITDLLARSVKAQMKYANKVNASFAMILGDNEIETGIAKLKIMKTGEELEVPLDDIREIAEIIDKLTYDNIISE